MSDENNVSAETLSKFRRGDFELVYEVTESNDGIITCRETNDADSIIDDDWVHLKTVYGDLVKDLTELVEKTHGTDRAHEFGRLVVEHASNDPRIDRDDAFNIITIPGVAQREAEAYTSFYELYPRGDYPSGVDPVVAGAVNDAYDDTHKARRVVETVTHHDTHVDKYTLQVWEDLRNTALDVNTVADAVVDALAHPPLESVEHVYLLADQTPPDTTDIETALPDDAAEQTRNGTLELTEINDTNTHHSHVFNDVNETEDGDPDFAAYIDDVWETKTGLAKWWAFGEAQHTASEQHDVSYREFRDRINQDVPRHKAVRARQFYTTFENGFDFTEDTISFTALYNLSRAFDDSETVRNAVERVVEAGETVQTAETRAIQKLDTPTAPSEDDITDALHQANVDVTQDHIDTIKLLCPPDPSASETPPEPTEPNPDEDTLPELPEVDTTPRFRVENTTDNEIIATELETREQAETQILEHRLTHNVPENPLTQTILTDTNTAFNPDTDTITPINNDDKHDITETYSHTIPTHTVVSYLTQFDEIVQYDAKNGFWKTLLGETSVNVTALTPTEPTKHLDMWRSGVEHAKPLQLRDHTDKPLFFTWPEHDNAEAVTALLVYAAKGGDTVLLYSEGPGGNLHQTFYKELNDNYTYAGTIDAVSWHGNTDALHVYTTTGDLPHEPVEQPQYEITPH